MTVSLRKKKLLSFLFLIACSSVFAKKQTDDTPLWVLDIKSVYNENEYVAKLGSGKNEKMAKIDALNYLSEYFETKVHSEGVMTRTVETGSNSSYSAQAIQKIEVQSNADLFCVEYEFYRDKKNKKYYCAAFINKEKYWKQMQPKLENKKYEFEKYYNEAESLFYNEPLLAKKYYMLCQKPWQEFYDLILMARLVVQEKANVFSSTEKRVFELGKKIKDTESRTVIFMDIQGDWSNTIGSSVKTIFENEKYNFTNNKRNCSHIMKIEIEQNQVVSGAGTVYETVSAAPSMTLTFVNSHTGQNLFSFSKKAEKSIAYNKDVALRKGYESLCAEVKKDLIENFKQKMFEIY